MSDVGVWMWDVMRKWSDGGREEMHRMSSYIRHPASNI